MVMEMRQAEIAQDAVYAITLQEHAVVSQDSMGQCVNIRLLFFNLNEKNKLI